MYKIAINGFGRIGRNIVRALYERPELQDKIKIVAINDLGSLEINAHLLQFDSVHGRFNQQVEVTDNTIVINGDVIHWSSERNPADLPWSKLGVDLVCECTGVFTSREKAALHLAAGAKKVLISAPRRRCRCHCCVRCERQRARRLTNDYFQCFLHHKLLSAHGTNSS